MKRELSRDGNNFHTEKLKFSLRRDTIADLKKIENLLQKKAKPCKNSFWRLNFPLKSTKEESNAKLRE